MRDFAKRIGHLVDTRKKVLVPFVFFLFAAALLANTWSTPIEDLGPDGRTYEALGYEAATSNSIVACGNFRHAYWSPAWVSAIAAVYRVAGRDPRAIRYLLVLIALVTSALVYLVTTVVAGSLAAIAAACLFTFSTLVFRFTAYTHYEIPYAFLTFVVGFLVFYRLKERPKRWGLPATLTAGDVLQLVAAGVALGVATLTSARVFAMAFFIGACFFAKGRMAYVLRAFPPFMLGVVLVLAPWTVRNRFCYGEWILATTNGGWNFYVGNNESSTLGYRTPPDEIKPRAPVHESRAYTRAALDYIAEHPLHTIRRTVVKLFKFWNPHYGDQVIVFLLFWIGVIRLVRNRAGPINPGVLWIVSVPLMFMLIHAAFYVQARYVIPALPCIAVVAGAGLCGWLPSEDARAEAAPALR